MAYFYNSEISRYSYPSDHPMKPERIAMAHNLVVQYGLYPKLDVYMTRKATALELAKFHIRPYVDYLSNYVSSSIVSNYDLLGITSIMGLRSQEERRTNINELKLKQMYKVGDSFDCPAFNGLYDFCQLSAGGSIDCARTIIYGEADVAINWGGGLHHAKKCEASGFCYVNDIVLCILELLEVYPRVLYLDIDVHHGDGVEEAFYLTNRVMTVSFHQYGDDFFPGTGNISSVGQGEGKHYSLNIPLKKGISDNRYF
ncbi:MAG: hypothetical protein JST59_00750 [Actinobacteria bacterium]|nr:hypothetical protein [Actinomycetota bacterium]